MHTYKKKLLVIIQIIYLNIKSIIIIHMREIFETHAYY